MFVLLTCDVNTEDADGKKTITRLAKAVCKLWTACAEFGIRVHTRSGAVPQVKS